MCLVLVFTSLYLPATANEVEIYDFDNITKADSMVFVELYGVDIPETLSQSENLSTLTQEIIRAVSSDPDISFAYYNDLAIRQYAEDIRALVREFKGLGLIFPNNMAYYCLQHSKVMNEDGEWVTSGGDYDQKWVNYNCYAYAINRREYPAFYSTEIENSGQRLQYKLGVISGQDEWENGDLDVQEVANVVVDDLKAIGILIKDTKDGIEWTLE